MLRILDGNVEVTGAVYKNVMTAMAELSDGRGSLDFKGRILLVPKESCGSTVSRVLPQCAVDIADRR